MRDPFSYRTTKAGEVFIERGGRRVTTLCGPAAERFLGRVEREDAQGLMARATGNYKQGNER